MRCLFFANITFLTCFCCHGNHFHWDFYPTYAIYPIFYPWYLFLSIFLSLNLISVFQQLTYWFCLSYNMLMLFNGEVLCVKFHSPIPWKKANRNNSKNIMNKISQFICTNENVLNAIWHSIIWLIFFQSESTACFICTMSVDAWR